LMLIKMARFFLDNPYREAYLRQLAKILKISPFAAKKYADFLSKEGLIAEERRANLRYLKANAGNLFFKYLKIAHSINLLLKSGLVDFLKGNIANVSSIVLFGSMAKGENDKKSDIDLLVIGQEKYISLGQFEEKLGCEVTAHIYSWSKWNKKAKGDPAFYNEVTGHGIPLYGELPIIKWK